MFFNFFFEQSNEFQEIIKAFFKIIYHKTSIIFPLNYNKTYYQRSFLLPFKEIISCKDHEKCNFLEDYFIPLKNLRKCFKM